MPLFSAESEGFEPPVRRNAYTAFRVRLFRPLRQLSSKVGAKVLLFYDICKDFNKKSAFGALFLFSYPSVRYFTSTPSALKYLPSRMMKSCPSRISLVASTDLP